MTKEDRSEYFRVYYLENQEKIREQQREYSKRNKEKISQSKKDYYIKNRDEIIKKTRKYKQNNPEKTKCHSILRYALKINTITKPNKCSNFNCNNTNNLEGHHPDYSKPLEVMWLCVSCHHILHNNIQEGIKIC